MSALFSRLFVAASLLVTPALSQEREKPVSSEVAAMLRVVEDKDGFTNIRAGASLESKVAGKVLTGSAVCVEETEGEWAKISDDSGKGRDLYIHTSRLQPVQKWKQTAGTAAAGSESGSVKADALEVKTSEVPFVEKDHKITSDGEGQKSVDGHATWGTDGGLPRKSLKITVKLDGREVTIPAEATRDLYEPNHETLAVLTPGKPGTLAFVYMEASDGAGAYSFVLSFKDGKYAGRTVFSIN
jgi:hypothetical protein